MNDTRWRAIPYAEMDATQDKDLMFFGDPSDEIAVAEYRARVRRLVSCPPPRLWRRSTTAAAAPARR